MDMEIRTYRAIKAPPGEAEMVTSFWKLGTILLPLTFSHFYYDVVESCSAPPTSCFHKVPRTGGQRATLRPPERQARGEMLAATAAATPAATPQLIWMAQSDWHEYECWPAAEYAERRRANVELRASDR